MIDIIAPYLSAINAFFSIAVLTTIFNLIKSHRETTTERINTLLARIDALKEDSIKNDKYYLREKEQLEREKKEKESELKKMQGQLEEVLKGEGVTIHNLALGQTLKESNNEVKNLIAELSEKMTMQIKEISDNGIRQDQIISQSQLTLAKAQMARGSFNDAATNFEQYTTNEKASWEVHFSKAVNLANLRQGKISNAASARAYSDAISLLPNNIDPNTRARVFGYRGAIFKRLGRFDESEADLKIAQKYATADYEVDDIHYNLSCVYAMQGNKNEMLSNVLKIKNKKIIHTIEHHLYDYFEQFANDEDFKYLLLSKRRG
jgi:tetratricopeptide (TPR) repeat protein